MSKSRFTRVLLAISLGTGLVCILWYAPDSMASFVRGCFMIPGALVAILGVLIFGYYQPVFDPVTFIGNALFYSWLAFMLLKLVKEKRAKPTTDAESTKTVTQSQ